MRLTILMPFMASALLGQTGAISGTVLDEAGASRANAWVTAIRTGLPPASGRAATDSKGAFTVSNLPLGNYRICVQAPEGGYLDPCTWTGSAAQEQREVAVRAGQTTSGVNINLETAFRLQVQLNDPQGLLAGHPERDVIVGVFTPDGLFQPAPVKISSALSRVHEISIPFSRATRLHVSSAKVNLNDTTGAAVPTAGSAPSITATKTGPTIGPVAYNLVSLKP